MVQNLSGSGMGSMGSINKVGMTNNGRVVYQISDPSGKAAGNISVAQKDADTFEKSYRDIMESAPKLQKYVQTTPPEKMEKAQKKAKWIVMGTTLIGALIPMLKTKGEGFTGFLKQALFTLLGGGVGLGLGVAVASKTCTPPGSAQFTKATKALSKLDIQPVQE